MRDSEETPVELVECDGGGVRLAVKVKPGGRGNQLLGAHAGALKMEVTAAPERGKANAAVIKLLSRTLGVARGDVDIVGGLTSRNKVVVVNGTTPRELSERLHRAGIPTIVTERS